MNAYKNIWRTWKTHQIPKKFTPLNQSWIIKNPDYQIQLYNDEECSNFITSNFNERIIKAYHAMPLGVMKADFWRYLVVYKHGGYYCDIDSQCKVALSDWLPQNAKFAISKETSFYFVQWAFYSEPGHKVFEYLIELICDRVLVEGIDVHYKIGNSKKFDTFVHYYTGPLVWTEAILKYINELLDTQIQDIEQLNERHVRLLKAQGFYIYDFDHFSQMNTHEAASILGYIRNYSSWRKEIKKKYTPRFGYLSRLFNLKKNT
ncbi:glycosyltransferase family 32 protein [uncultured Legionella sp.]|uniref:glycosyltransferase family 32 protein n=1 Tax=uncultured Legionella sp. TaxID=210934 RepID=UPI00261B8D52|nr:glycosyltransferase [uncultured Legionella sp.]